MKVDDLFDFLTGSLPSLDRTEDGDIPLVYGGADNNGVAKFVKVRNDNEMFQPPKITVSYLGTAFVQVVAFTTSVVDKSNIIVLEPKKPMTLEEMYFHAFQINRAARFGFYYSRRMNMRQLAKLELLPYKDRSKRIDFSTMLPRLTNHRKDGTKPVNLKNISLTSQFDIVRGRGEYLQDLKSGDTPLISATSKDNGILGYVDLTPTFHAPAITVERVSGQAFVQLRDFATVPADISVLVPRDPMPIEPMFFIAAVVNLEKWRYSYGRKLTIGRLETMHVPLPINNEGKPDYDVMTKTVELSYGWSAVKSFAS